MFKPIYYHIGIVVHDYRAAVEHYSNVLGVKFTEPTDSVLCIENPRTQQTESIKVVATYSRALPPYLELIQANGSGIFSEKNAGRILYFGIWEPDMEGRIDKLKQQGIDIDALIRPECDKPVNAIITAPDKMGVRMEYLSKSLRVATEAWVLTGKFPVLGH
ncbi:Glyoxalase/Bleomycin resistance protein/Dioxygenase superfamily protein [Nitrosospira sp. Nl5]|uniref:VOC family protein n=1 Tax=Nitrosospira sp. Nl5 TaxID=200120 RepID=UPI00088FF63F|nr:VOC family protein [Nitrosospira sp. Nl5]SCY30216.1 Glyoxalase/Bleomycin resistance protein/Dioxygenase superfamily protein [Nitrosospira sp. Nl5]